jgi:dihydroneopterin aldolase
MDDVLTASSPAVTKPEYHTVDCEVRLDNIDVMADIGALAVELGVLQPLRIKVALRITAPKIDHLSQTFDYTNIRTHAIELAGRRIVLIETFAQELARRCLEADIVNEAEIWIEKPKAVPGCMAGTYVRLTKD